MHHLISRFILEKYASGEYSGSLPAASIFVDVSGFSTLTEALARQGDRGAEVLAEVMGALFEPLVDAVYAQGGFVVGYAGDSFTAIFGEQEGWGRAVERALAASVRMQEHLGAHPLIQTKFDSFPIAIKVGLDYGEADWLIIKDTAAGRATYCVRGSSVDGAVSAEGLAGEREIILGASAVDLLRDLVQTVPVSDGCKLVEVKTQLPPPRPFVLPDIDPGLMADFYPRNLIEQEFRGEFRPVVNVFIDIPVDPTDATFITPFMENVFALQQRYGGFFLRPDMGDKGFNILMVWGAPTSHENDIDRALNFVLDLHKFTHLDFRAGITYKLAYAGFIGARPREDYTAYGWGVNLASRMMEAAGSGEFWLDEEIRKRASRRFAMEDLGAIEFKGFMTKINACRLQHRKRLADLAFRGDLVGREAELDRLTRFLEPIRQGEFAGLLVVRGETGIGKSRLVHSLQDRMIGTSQTEWVVCQANEILREPFEPFRDWLMKRFGITDEQSDQERMKAFETGLMTLVDFTNESGLSAELMRTASVLAALVNIEQAGSLYEQLDAKGRHDNTLIALSAVLRAMAAGGPLVILIEDLQWLDEESRAFMTYFVRVLQSEPEKKYGVAILVTARPEAEWPDIEEVLLVEQLILEPLSPANLAAQVGSLLGSKPTPELIQLLERRSEGNPFFAEQILLYLAENDLLLKGSDGSLMPRETSHDSIPSDVQAVLIARLDRLSTAIREVIQTASVLGREFETRLLASMLWGDDELPQKIVAAEEADIWFALNEVEYIFRHALVREAAYGMQLLTRQHALHSLALDAMESLYADDLDSHLGELAYHAERASLGLKAYGYLVQAAHGAADVYQNFQAIDYLSRALALNPSDDLAAEFDLLEERVELHSRTGNRTEQLRDLERMGALAKQLGEEGRFVRVWSLQSLYHIVLAEYPEAIQFAERTIAGARGSSEVEAPLVAYNTWSISLLRLGRVRTAVKVAREGLELARSRKNQYYEGLALNSLGMIAHEEEDAGAAEDYLRQAKEVAEAINDNALKARVLTNLGNTAGFLRKDYSAARRYYEEVYSILLERGERNAQALVLLNWAWVAGVLGDFTASRAYNSEALAISREIGNLHTEAYSLINLSAVMSIQGDSQEALEAAQQASRITRRTGDRAGESWALLNMGHAYLAAGELDKADESYSDCVTLRLSLDQPGFEMEPMAGLVQVALRQADLEKALRSTGHILAHLDRGGTLESTEEPLRIYHACYETLLQANDPRARSLLNEAGRLLDTQMSKLPDETDRQIFLNSAPWRGAIQRAREGEQ